MTVMSTPCSSQNLLFVHSTYYLFERLTKRTCISLERIQILELIKSEKQKKKSFEKIWSKRDDSEINGSPGQKVIPCTSLKSEQLLVVT